MQNRCPRNLFQIVGELFLCFLSLTQRELSSTSIALFGVFVIIVISFELGFINNFSPYYQERGLGMSDQQTVTGLILFLTRMPRNMPYNLPNGLVAKTASERPGIDFAKSF